MFCRFCTKEIKDNERRFYSRQASLKGLYHWECFIEACRQANRAKEDGIDSLFSSTNATDVQNDQDD